MRAKIELNENAAPPALGRPGDNFYAVTFLTLPERIQRVQTRIRVWDPFGPWAFILWMFGFDVLFVLLLA